MPPYHLPVVNYAKLDVGDIQQQNELERVIDH